MKTNDTIHEKTTAKHQHGKFSVFIANNKKSIEACLQLRHEVYNTGTNTSSKNIENKVTTDRFDSLSKHIMVIEKATNRVVATTRVLSSTDITYTGFFYLETEFDISSLHDLPGNIMEVGRVCIHKDFHKGIVLGRLLQGIAKVISLKKIDYVIGSACIKINNNEYNIKPIMQHLRRYYFSNEDNRVHPLVSISTDEINYNDTVLLPNLLKGYIHQGAVVCGEPYWDAKTRVADVFVLLEVKKMSKRYLRYSSNKMSA